MSSAEVQGVFDVEEDQSYSYSINDTVNTVTEEHTTESPSGFLNNLSQLPVSESTLKESQFSSQPSNSTTASSSFSKPTEFIPVISPSLMLSSMANSSPATENILSSAKERLSQIRPWNDFFSLDQFRIPESSTAAQSRASHNCSYFQNNYLIIFLLFCTFSL